MIDEWVDFNEGEIKINNFLTPAYKKNRLKKIQQKDIMRFFSNEGYIVTTNNDYSITVLNKKGDSVIAILKWVNKQGWVSYLASPVLYTQNDLKILYSAIETDNKIKEKIKKTWERYKTKKNDSNWLSYLGSQWYYFYKSSDMVGIVKQMVIMSKQMINSGCDNTITQAIVKEWKEKGF